jgi:hypothetical protein
MRTPWIGLAALVAMFVLPFVPAWLFEGPRTVKHRPRRRICADCEAPLTDGHVCGPLTITRWPAREVCGDCGAPWTDGHHCTPDEAVDDRPLHADLRRPTAGALPRPATRDLSVHRRRGAREDDWPPPAA